MEFHSAKRLTEEGKPKVVLVDIMKQSAIIKIRITEGTTYQFPFKKI